MFFFDPLYFIILAPALLLAGWAQLRVRSTFNQGMRIPTRMTGAEAARYLLDQAGCQNVEIEPVAGHLTDHYDPRGHVLRLSREVYGSRTASAVGIAAHEAGHALQHAHGYAPLALRNIAVPAAQWGPGISIVLLIIGALMQSGPLVLAGLVAFGGLLVFQVVNLPVEFNASTRAKQMLDEYGIVDASGGAAVRSVLNAAAWTYVAATLQTLLTLIYYIMRFGGIIRSND